MNFWTWAGLVIGFLIGVVWHQMVVQNRIIELESENHELKDRLGIPDVDLSKCMSDGAEM